LDKKIVKVIERLKSLREELDRDDKNKYTKAISFLESCGMTFDQLQRGPASLILGTRGIGRATYLVIREQIPHKPDNWFKCPHCGGDIISH